LAEYSKIIQKQNHPEDLKIFAVHMMDHWISRDPQASAGVAIGAESGSRTHNSFRRLPELMPSFARPAGLVGLVAEADGFAQLARRVRELVWNGL
jgi:hypothetical protein